VSEIKRKKNESFESFMRRVKKRWQQSGKILQVKKIQYKGKKANKTLRRKSALHRLEMGEKIAYLKKIGRMPEEKTRSRR
jgi:ribosomal protein S21